MKISWSTLFGMAVGFGLFLYAIYSSTDHWVIFVSLSSLAMVIGGTLGATFIAYQGLYVFRTLKALLAILVPAASSPKVLQEDVRLVVAWSEEVKKKGIAILDDKFEAGEFDRLGDFGQWSYQLLASGYKGEELRGLLEQYVASEYDRSNVQVGILKTMGSFAPAFGMVGTLVGLVIMLDQLEGDPSAIGRGLALALITTLYGVIFANLLFKPAANKTEQKNDMLRFRQMLLVDGMVGISERMEPIKLQDRLNSQLGLGIHVDVFAPKVD